MLKIFKIKGDSLFPLFKNGQIVLTLHVKFCKLKIDDIVVFHQKDYGLMIKKIQKIQDDKLYLTGTIPQSIDSRNFGFIDKKDIKYKVLFSLF